MLVSRTAAVTRGRAAGAPPTVLCTHLGDCLGNLWLKLFVWYAHECRRGCFFPGFESQSFELLGPRGFVLTEAGEVGGGDERRGRRPITLDQQARLATGDPIEQVGPAAAGFV